MIYRLTISKYSNGTSLDLFNELINRGFIFSHRRYNRVTLSLKVASKEDSIVWILFNHSECKKVFSDVRCRIDVNTFRQHSISETESMFNTCEQEGKPFSVNIVTNNCFGQTEIFDLRETKEITFEELLQLRLTE